VIEFLAAGLGSQVEPKNVAEQPPPQSLGKSKSTQNHGQQAAKREEATDVVPARGLPSSSRANSNKTSVLHHISTTTSKLETKFLDVTAAGTAALITPKSTDQNANARARRPKRGTASLVVLQYLGVLNFSIQVLIAHAARAEEHSEPDVPILQVRWPPGPNSQLKRGIRATLLIWAWQPHPH